MAAMRAHARRRHPHALMSRAAGLPRLSWFAGLTWFAGGSTGAGCAAHPALAGLTAGA
ncbi:hypothetical protein TMKG_00150, partial [Mycobacterium tuberculosis SUMu011]